MKRTFAVTIVSAFLAIASPAYACIGAPGLEPLNSANQWGSWDSVGRALYILGFRDGMQRVITHSSLVVRLDPTDLNAFQTVAAQWILRHDLRQIGDVMTNLYADPANAYIDLGAMVLIAHGKLDGKNAEELLIEARINDCAYRSTR
jgi:hypothetical protein